MIGYPYFAAQPSIQDESFDYIVWQILIAVPPKRLSAVS